EPAPGARSPRRPRCERGRGRPRHRRASNAVPRDTAQLRGVVPPGAGAAARRPDGVLMATVARPREVRLTTLLEAMPGGQVLGQLPHTVTGLTDDSRQVTAGSCFVAVRGLRADGHRFIPQAVERGARAVVSEPPDPLPGEAVGRILVPDTRRTLPRLADAYYGHPSRALTAVGITGANGKTTSSYLCDALLPAT